MIAAFDVAFAGNFVLKKWVVLVFITMALTGCGYKGALYIPQAPEQNAPDDESNNAVPSSTLPRSPASTSGESN
ncbi:hypothetical protein EP12_01010 [Alteromonas australica]|jgi:predicted small lipoprotein YifL|nr:hypothetical protein EP12_01010 [Alteromonas australica]MAO29057.1 hypothetical protein [Alteromonas sp.]HBF71439.1 hypothetical protein [Alteromonas australica]|tara:strand:- start:16305 stop:16526 length:222 start_codon:yes stop_codon:yes gene_type:complete